MTASLLGCEWAHTLLEEFVKLGMVFEVSVIAIILLRGRIDSMFHGHGAVQNFD